MYTKQEAAKQREAFWTTFGKYMQPIPSADGIKVNWVNYKTGIPGISFRMDADSKQATIAIMLSQNDIGMQQLYFDQFIQLNAMLTSALNEDWEWQPLIQDEYGKTISTISKTISDVNINRNEDWPQLIPFFKQRIIALDEFWSMAKYGFENIST